MTPKAIENAVKNLRNHYVYHPAHYYYSRGIVENLAAHIYDKYFRKPWNTTGHFIAYRNELYNVVQFDLNAKVGEDDYKFGYDVYRKLGSEALFFDFNTVILVSNRRIKREGFINYYINHIKDIF